MYNFFTEIEIAIQHTSSFLRQNWNILQLSNFKIHFFVTSLPKYSVPYHPETANLFEPPRPVMKNVFNSFKKISMPFPAIFTKYEIKWRFTWDRRYRLCNLCLYVDI